jgi:ABC-type dipeptide/oligopeptide/nickel transport system permease subunit
VTAGVEAASITISEAPRSNARRVLARFARNRTALIGLVLVTLFVLVAVFGPMLAPYDPTRTNWSAVRKPPSAMFWFGTDELGRDVFARLVYGARASLLAGVVSVAIAFTVGVPFGMIPGYLGGWIDTVVMRIVDALLAVPFLVLAIAFAAFLGPSLTNAMIARLSSFEKRSSSRRPAPSARRTGRSCCATSSPTRCRRSSCK